MKIIQANKFFYQRRGAERVMFTQIEELEKRGFEVFPFAMKYEENFESEFDKYFVSNLATESLRISQVPKYLGRALWSKEASRKLGELISETEADIFHGHNLYTQLSPSVLWTAKKAGLKTVISLHDYGLISANYALWDGEKPLSPAEMTFGEIVKSKYIKNSAVATGVLELIVRWQKWRKYYEKYTDKFLAVSEAVKKAMIEAGYNGDKIEILPNPAPEKVKVGGDFDEREGVLFFGQVDASKGVMMAIEATKKDKKKLFIAGNGNLVSEVKRYNNVRYLGRLNQEELQEMMTKVKCAVFPSKWSEPYSMAGIEAMAAGLPVIVSDRGGFPEMVNYGKAGMLANPDEVGAWTEMIKDLCDNRRIWQNYREQALLQIEAKASLDKYMNRLIKIYQELLEN